MRTDFWRLSWVLLIAFLSGLLLGNVFFWLFVFTLGYGIWQQRQLYRLYRWLQKPKKRPPPSAGGVMEGIVREIDFMRERHRSRKGKLSQYLQRFQKATAALPDATVILNKYGEIEWANEASRRLLGLKWPRDAGQRLSNLVRHPDFVELMQLGSKAPGALELPSPVNSALRLNVRIVPYAEGYRLLVVQDITRIHRLERTRRDFIANISHEMRTPLTVLRGYLEVLEGGGDADLKTCARSFKAMRDQAARMQHLIEDLLTLSRLESQEKKPVEVPIAVPEMLEGICREARILSGERQHPIQLKADTRLWLQGDEQEIHSAFSNLIINAVRYTPAQGDITVHWYKQVDRPCLEVRDSGEGIATEHIPRLTERFYRVDEGRSREKGGTGLGLAIVKHILSRHGARLEIESKLGEGSLFRCLFPARRSQQPKVRLSKAG